MMKRGLTLATFAIVIVGLLAGCEKEPLPDTPMPVRPVKYAVVAASEGARRHTFSGTAKADVEADISFKVAGTVQARPVQVGEEVAPGQLLAELDARDFRIRVSEADAQLANARAALRNAEANYDRVRNLYENDNVARSDLDVARANAESAEAQVEIARQNLANSRLQLSYTRVVSPGVCSIAETFVKVSENISSGQAVVRLNCGDCAEVRVSVPETHIGGIAVGNAAQVSVAAAPGQSLSAIVTEVGVAMPGGAAAFPVVVKLNEPCAQVRPGMAADVSFNYDLIGASDTLMIPIVAVGEDRDGRYVYVLESDADEHWSARRRAVEVAEPQPGGIPVISGLAAGERVVTAGVRRITDGQRVRLYEGEL